MNNQSVKYLNEVYHLVVESLKGYTDMLKLTNAEKISTLINNICLDRMHVLTHLNEKIMQEELLIENKFDDLHLKLKSNYFWVKLENSIHTNNLDLILKEFKKVEKYYIFSLNKILFETPGLDFSLIELVTKTKNILSIRYNQLVTGQFEFETHPHVLSQL